MILYEFTQAVPYATAKTVCNLLPHVVLRLKDAGGRLHYLVVEQVHGIQSSPDGSFFTADTHDDLHMTKYTLTVWPSRNRMQLSSR